MARSKGRFRATTGLVARRLMQAVPTLLGVLLINFFLIRLIPGDTVDALLPEGYASDDELRTRLRAELGLDRPVWTQFGIYLLNVAQGDFGFSYQHTKPVIDVILERAGPTILLMASSIFAALLMGTTLGVLAARGVHTAKDALITVFALLFYATPTFWIGLMLIVLFAIKLQVLPIGGFQTVGGDFTGLALVFDVAKHLVLPTVTLSLYYAAVYTRLMRAAMLEVQQMDFVRTARAKGLPEGAVAFRHVLRNALIPVVTLLGLQIGAMLGGAVVVETVFGWPGLGRLAYESVLQRDYNLLLAILFASVVIVVAVNILIDLLYLWIDPRIELR